jgi:hypothetical protein
LLIASLCWGTTRAPAQFAGNSADGFARDAGNAVNKRPDGAAFPTSAASGFAGDGFAAASGLHNVRPDGSGLSASSFLGGVGGGDGFDRLGVLHVRPDGQSVPIDAFSGSVNGGDGFDRLGVAHVRADGQSDPAQVFSGSANGADGFDRLSVANIRPDGAIDPSAVFSSSASGGDGFDRLGLTNIRPDGQIAPAEPYSGSANGGDGFDRMLLAHVRPDGQTDPLAAFSGSASGADGFDRLGLLNQTLAGSVTSSPFGGGLADGWTAASAPMLELTPLSPAAFGGAGGDGFDRDAFPPNTVIDPSVAYFAWQAVYFSPSEVGGGLGDPDADPDGDGWVNAVEYALDANPRVADGDDLVAYTLTPFLTVLVTKAPYRPHAVFSAQTSPEVSPWTPSATVVLTDTATEFIARDAESVGAQLRKFLRLVITLEP